MSKAKPPLDPAVEKELTQAIKERCRGRTVGGHWH